MGTRREDRPFFCQFARDLEEINERPEEALEKLIAREPVFFQTSMFRAFLRMDKEEIDNLGFDQFINCSIMLKEVLKVIHAPYINKEEVNVS